MRETLTLRAAPAGKRVGNGLDRALSRLPDAWTILRDCDFGAAAVGFVALHAKFGVALVDRPAGQPERAIAPLGAALAAAGFAARFPGRLPVVAATIAAADSAPIEDRIVAAFSGQPACTIADPRWCDAATEILLGEMPDAPRDATVPAAGAAVVPARLPASPRQPDRILGYAAMVGAVALVIICAAYALHQPSVREKLGLVTPHHDTPEVAAPALAMPATPPSAAALPAVATPAPVMTVPDLPVPQPVPPSALPPAAAAAAPRAGFAATAAPAPQATFPPLPAERPERPARRFAIHDAAAGRAVRTFDNPADRPAAATLAPAADLPPIDPTDLPPLPGGYSRPTPPIPQEAVAPTMAPPLRDADSQAPSAAGSALGRPISLLPPGQ